MARASLSIPVQSNSVRLSPEQVAKLAGVEIESEAAIEAWVEYAEQYEDVNLRAITRYERVVPTFVDLRPRGALARAFA